MKKKSLWVNGEPAKYLVIDFDLGDNNNITLKEEKLFGGNIPESLEEMAEAYLDVRDIKDDEMKVKDRHKNKAIKALIKVKNIASKKDLVYKNGKFYSSRNHGEDNEMKALIEKKGNELER